MVSSSLKDKEWALFMLVSPSLAEWALFMLVSPSLAKCKLDTVPDTD